MTTTTRNHDFTDPATGYSYGITMQDDVLTETRVSVPTFLMGDDGWTQGWQVQTIAHDAHGLPILPPDPWAPAVDRVRVIVDDADTRAWSTLERRYAEDGTLLSTLRVGDNGVAAETSTDMQGMTVTRWSDGADAFAWSYREVARAEDGTVYQQVTIADSGLMTAWQATWDGGRETVHTDLADDRAWAVRVTVTDGDGNRLSQSVTDDGGRVTTRTWDADGTLQTIVQEDAGDEFAWALNTVTLHEDGSRETARLGDNGLLVRTVRDAEGEVVSVDRIDTLDAFDFRSITQTQEDGVALTVTVFDDGVRLTSGGLEGGHVFTDDERAHEWASIQSEDDEIGVGDIAIWDDGTTRIGVEDDAGALAWEELGLL